MARVRRPDTAFSLDPSGKHTKPMKDPKHLAFIRKLPCLITGAYGVEAAHIRMASARHGKPSTGKSQRPSDAWTIPLSPDVHRSQHSGSESAFWADAAIDPCDVAQALYSVSGDEEQGTQIITKYARKR